MLWEFLIAENGDELQGGGKTLTTCLVHKREGQTSLLRQVLYFAIASYIKSAYHIVLYHIVSYQTYHCHDFIFQVSE